MLPEHLTSPTSSEWQRLDTRGRGILGMREKLVALIGSHGGGDAGSLLAKPEFDQESGDTLGWRSPFGGRLVPAESDEGHKAVADRIAAIAERLDGEGDAGRLAAHSLRSALVTPDGAAAYFIDSENGKPVLVNWGMAMPQQERPLLAEAAEARQADPATIRRAASADGIETGTEDVDAGALPSAAGLKSAKRHTALILLPWLVPIAIAVLLVWLGLQAMKPLPVVVSETIPEAPPAGDPIAGLDAQLAAIEAGIGEADAALPHFAEVCVIPLPPPQLSALPLATPAPEPENPVAVVPEAAPNDETVVLAPQDDAPLGAPSPESSPMPEIKAAVPKGAPTPPGQVEPKRAAPTRPALPEPRVGSACKPNWPPGRSPRMVFVVDGSGSMSDGIAGAPSRMAAAQSSINRVVRSLHKDIRIGMVSFSDCGATRNSRYYSAAERGQLLGQVNAIRPSRRTSLAASIRRAGALATRRAETVIVVVSDGADTCGSDPCAAARLIRSRKPNLKINVIDLSGGSSARVLQCIASAGGGRVFTPHSAGQMSGQLQQATGQPDASGC
jgi:hypothetical protein